VTVEAQLASLLRGEVLNIVASTFFLFIGLIALSIAAIRPRSSAKLLLWLGIWSGMYGIQELLQSDPVVRSLPSAIQAARESVLVLFAYSMIVVATLTFLELTLGLMHRLLQVFLAVNLALAVLAMVLFVVSRSQDSLLVFNEALVIVLLVTLILTLSIPALSRRFLVVAQHRVLTLGTFLFAAQALFVNVVRPFQVNVPRIYNTVGFAIFLLAIGYTGMDIMLRDERRLLALDDELTIARQLQFSILPEQTPRIAGLDIAAVYQPMSAVAGDFYEFIIGDERHAGFLIADVSGHGVPAALIASMIKVATQTANGCASNPAQLLQSVGNVLNTNARGQLVSAAYLWIDMTSRTATYSAAGHPPLIRWRRTDSTFSRVESNGLLFGINAASEYPVCSFPLVAGDRYLLYTDGITEPENQAGQQFGERRLEQIMRDTEGRRASELAQFLQTEIRAWQPSNMAQQDDLTLILIDVL
jgi:sigma-B regulation protein RsbU (phosphoserine phosphatase)